MCEKTYRREGSTAGKPSAEIASRDRPSPNEDHGDAGNLDNQKPWFAHVALAPSPVPVFRLAAWALAMRGFISTQG